MINIELKLKVNDFKKIFSNLKNINAKFEGLLSQIDTYYNCKGKRLKIREINNKSYQLIDYLRQDRTDSKISDYKIQELDKKQLKQYKQQFKNMYGESVIIHKNRELWIYKNTRIHLDKVRKLGKYIELETVIKNSERFSQLEKEHKDVIKLLNLDEYVKVSKSYSDLLSEKNSPKKITITHLAKQAKLNN